MRAAKMWRRGRFAFALRGDSISSLRHRERLAARFIESFKSSPNTPARFKEANDVSNRGKRIASS